MNTASLRLGEVVGQGESVMGDGGGGADRVCVGGLRRVGHNHVHRHLHVQDSVTCMNVSHREAAIRHDNETPKK